MTGIDCRKGRVAILAALTLVGAMPARAQSPEPEAVGEWADAHFPTLVEEGRITGAVVAAVAGGEVVYARGFGEADVVTGAAASADSTLVRIGSNTKTFTATILAQLVDEGRIDSLDDPANRYLQRIQLPDNDGQPITLRHLLTHTAGFADRFFFIGSKRPVDLPASPSVIESLRPEYARPAGERIVYSNFGVAVLGYLIEDVTGNTIDQEMRERLFAPIGMNRTRLLTDIGEPDGLAKPGVLPADGVPRPTPFTAINPAVAQTGSIVSTAADMARYLNAQLGHGDVIAESARLRLQTRLAGNAEGLTELGMVFFLDEWAGHRTVSHGGNWAGFHSWMTILPDDDFGIFVALLSDARAESIGERFVRAALPSLAAPPSPAQLSAYGTVNTALAALLGDKRAPGGSRAIENPEQIEGLYIADRRPFTTIEALSSLVYFGAGALPVRVEDDGLYLGDAGPWQPSGEQTYVLDVPTRPMIAIRPPGQGGDAMLVPDIGIYTFTRVGAWRNPKLQAIAVHVAVPLTVVGLLALMWLGRSRRALAPAAVGACGLVMSICASVFAEPGLSLMSSYYDGEPARLVIFVVAANLQLLSALLSVPALLDPKLGRARRTVIAAVLLAALVAAAVLWQHNAIGIHRI